METLDSNVNLDNIQSLTFKDVGTMQYVWLGVELSLMQYMRKNKHDTWTIIFALLSLGTAGSIIEDIRKP